VNVFIILLSDITQPQGMVVVKYAHDCTVQCTAHDCTA